MIIQHNMDAMFSNRQLGITYVNKAKSAEKLSSGYRINRAADDAAGLAISEKMRREIRGLFQGSANIQDGVSLCQVADGYLNEVHDMLQRINELAVQGANDTLDDTDRSYLNQEVSALKEEMARIFDTATFNEIPIFHTPYLPEVTPDPEPYDIQVFYSSSGQIGGLEFNNVRYSIEELRNIPSSLGQSLQIDENGIATADQEIEFKLNYESGELVKLKLNKGESLSDVKRTYEWQAKDDGIYINNILATSWENMGINTSGVNAGGIRSFSYRGMKIEINVEDGDDLSEIKKGINGEGFDSQSMWDISVAGTNQRSIAPIIDSSTINGQDISSTVTVKVNSSNKNVIADKYVLSANSQGLAIKNATTGAVTSRTFWSSFTNVDNSLTPKYGSGDSASYPIKDWGLDNDWGTSHPNDSSEITFDGDATYHYKSADTSVPIELYFTLAGGASLEEVINTLDGKEISGDINAPTMLSVTSTPSNSSFSISSVQIDGNNELAIKLQVEYGRQFNSNYNADTLSGRVTWKKNIISGEPDDGQKSSSTSNRSSTVSNSSTSAGGNEYYRVDNGDGTYTYYKAEKTNHTDTQVYQYDKNYSWNEQYRLDYSGTLGTASMKNVSGNDVTMQYGRTDRIRHTDTLSYATYAVSQANTAEIAGLSGDYFNDSTRTKSADEITSLGSGRHDITTNSSDTILTQGTKTLKSNGTYSTVGNFVTDADSQNEYAFRFSHSISYSELANMANGSTAASNLSLQALSEATRTFSPAQNNATLSEPDFLSIVVVPPDKHCFIQCAPDAGDPYEIELVWSSLNLTTAGISAADLSTTSRCRATIELAKESIKIISKTSSNFGAYQNRLEHAMRYTDNTAENTQASESRIRDTDMAKEISHLSSNEILAQAGQMILAQANQSTNGVLSL